MPASNRRTRRGFGRIQRQRSGRWAAAYTHDGRLYRAPHTFSAKIDAEGWLTDRRREIDRGLWSPPPDPAAVAEARRAARRSVRFKKYAEDWIDARMVRGRPLRPRTRGHYKQLLRDHLLPTFGDLGVRDITVGRVDRWYAETLTDRPTARAHTYQLLSAILATAVDRDRLIDRNPCQIRGAGTTRRASKTRPATIPELVALEAAMPAEYAAMIPLGAWCALRFGELAELRRQDIDLHAGLVMIRRAVARVKGGRVVGDPKSEAGIRDVAIPPHILPTLKAHMAAHVGGAEDALLFPGRGGGHLAPATFQRYFYRARDAVKRKDLRFHDLRHTGATAAAVAGATQAELMARLGHSTAQAAARYQWAAAGRDRQIAEALSRMAVDQSTTGATEQG